MPLDHEPATWTLMAETKRGRFCFGGDFPVSPVEVIGLTSAPELFTNYQRLISRDGMWKGTQYLGGRAVTLSMNILATGNLQINNVINELSWAFPIGYGTEQEEITLHFTIPGIANGGAAKIKGMVRKRDIKLDQQYAVNGAARIDIELYCHDPKVTGYGKATARMDMAEGFFLGGAPAPFEFSAGGGLLFPANWQAGAEHQVLITDNSIRVNEQGQEQGPKWMAELHGPIPNPILKRRNTFDNTYSIQLVEPFYLAEGQKLVYEQTGTNESPSGKVTLVEDGRQVEIPSKVTYAHAWKDIGVAKSQANADRISVSEYWFITNGNSDVPIDGNGYGFITWWGGEFI
ncbi:hypothetical protein [Streptomyces sp. NPDC059708]|uniref:hypothetical protein n=1 Tax=Streptomyces sp. NPDC059708 TaxID=3346916 RepID=UPI00367F1EFA